MHPVFALQALGQFVMELQSVMQGLPCNSPTCIQSRNSGAGMGAAKKNSSVGCGTFKQQVPFLDQRIGVIAAHPVHVIQQNEPGNALIGV